MRVSVRVLSYANVAVMLYECCRNAVPGPVGSSLHAILGLPQGLGEGLVAAGVDRQTWGKARELQGVTAMVYFL
jgi:hypothetical protein